jgi:hypothetical protein
MLVQLVHLKVAGFLLHRLAIGEVVLHAAMQLGWDVIRRQ